MDCSSIAPLPHHPANDDELAMLDCFDPDDPEISEFLVGGVGEFSDAGVDVVALDLPPLSETASAQHESLETTAEQDALLETPCLPPVSDDASMCSASLSPASDDASMCSAASGAKRPRRRSLTHAPPPPRSKPRQNTQQQHQQRQQQQQHSMLQRASSTPVNSGSSNGNGNNGGSADPYNAMLTKLAASMKRSEMSRASVMRQRQSMQNRPTASPSPVPSSSSSVGMTRPAQQQQQRTNAMRANQPAQQQQRSVPHFQSMIGLSGFLNGQRSTLTSGLEQSRMQLRAYMTQMNRFNSM